MAYLINQYGHYFAIASDIDVERLNQCRIAADKETMYQTVISEQQLDEDEVTGSEILIIREGGGWIQINSEGGRFCCDLREGERIEEYLSRLHL